MISHISISLDGFAAGPEPTLEEPLGKGGEGLHEWAIQTEAWRQSHGLSGGTSGADSEIAARMSEGMGAYVMGRNMFGGGPGPWDESWKGWWGEEPPYHVPVFVLTHHPREPLEMAGGTTFNFVTDGVQAALSAAREAAGQADVSVAGGADVIQQFLAAGLIDELFLHVAPVILGSGRRLLENVGDLELEPIETIGSPAATHVRYRVG